MMDMIELTAFSTIGLTLIGMQVKHMIDNNKRFTEECEKAEKKYVVREVCATSHKAIAEDLQEIKSDLKSLLRKNGIGG